MGAPPQPEDARQRAKLPLYKTLPAAEVSQLTPALETNLERNGWWRSNADAANTRYSPLTQIDRDNVAQLEVAWIYHSGSAGFDKTRSTRFNAIQANNIQANPIIADGVMYAPAKGGFVVALDATTGRERWRFQPPETSEPFGEGNLGPAHRGLVYWPGDGSQNARLFFTASGFVFALNPQDGQPVENFGAQGKARARGSVAPVVYRDLVIASDLGALVAFDVATGRPAWKFDIEDKPKEKTSHAAGDPAIATSNSDNYYPSGSVWGGAMALDESRGLVFFSTGAPHPNFAGMNRLGDNKHTNSVVALDARTGKLLWAFQDIAHDLWDLDIPAPPNLVTVTRVGKRVDAVAQVTKQGNTLLLDRLSGQPLFPFRLRRALVSQLPGERTAPYQPDVQWPQPFSRQSFTREDITDRTPQARAFVTKKLHDATLGWFEPPRADKHIVFYGVHGGAEWTGAAVDPAGILYVSANELAWLAWVARAPAGLVNASDAVKAGYHTYRLHCAECHGDNRAGKGMAPSLASVGERLNATQIETILGQGRNAMPPVPMDADERNRLLEFLFAKTSDGETFVDGGLEKLLDDEGYPGNRPPWGTLNAVDLNSGRLLWKVPLGEYEELTRQGMAKTGTENFGGATVTAGGLVFCAGTRDLKIRAFDRKDGRELWQYKLPYGGFAAPAVYEANGRQYVVIAATGGGKLGGELGDAYVAFTLPAERLSK